MANKDLFKDAIAEAKSVRAAAIANAKEALEETLTPHIKDMLAAKLQEMEDSSVEEEVVTEEEVEEEVTETVEETVEENFIPVEEAEEEEAEDEEDKEEDEAEEDADNDSEESEEEAEEEESEEEDIDLKDMSVEDLKDLIRTIVAQEADLEGEEALDGVEDLTGDEEELDSTGMEAGEELPAEVPGEETIDDEEINLEALLAELEALAETEEAVCPTCGNNTSESGCNKHEGHCAEEVTNEEVVSEEEKEDVKEEEKDEVKEELEEALTTIETLRSELNETNILNAKLLYVNKILKANRNLSENQVVNVISAFDKAETVKEVKLVFETVSENVVTKSQKSTIKESNLGSASKATGLTGKKPEVISEANAAVLRMQKLAGII